MDQLLLVHEDVLRERLQEEEAERADRARLEIEEQLQELAEFRRLRDMERERDQAEVAHYQRLLEQGEEQQRALNILPAPRVGEDPAAPRDPRTAPRASGISGLIKKIKPLFQAKKSKNLLPYLEIPLLIPRSAGPGRCDSPSGGPRRNVGTS